MQTTKTKEILRKLERGALSVADALAALRPTPVVYLGERWEPSPLARTPSSKSGGSLVVIDHDGGLSRARAEWLNGAGLGEVALVQGADADDDELVRKLRAALVSLAPVTRVVHLWSRHAELTAGGEPRELLRILACTNALTVASSPSSLRIIYAYAAESVRPEHAAMRGFFRSLEQERPGVIATVVRIEGDTLDEGLARVLDELDATASRPEVLLRADERLVLRVQRLAARQPLVRIRRGGAYLLTGGTGGIGLVLARALAERHDARLMLASRSARRDSLADEPMLARADQVIVAQADVTRVADVRALIERAHSVFGGLHGIIHAAGVSGEGVAAALDAERVRAAVAAKVRGAHVLDEASRGEALDFFVTFSSIAATLGSAGQSAYAYANRYLDAFAACRAEEVARGSRAGASISIDWPYWRDGGMRLDGGTEAWMRSALGLEPLGAQDGVQAFEAALGMGLPNVAVVPGDAAVLERLFEGERLGLQSAGASAMPATPTDVERARRAAEALLRDVIAKETRLSADRVRLREPLERIGIDSVMIMGLSRRLEARLGPLPKTLFFEHQTLEALRDYLAEHHAPTFVEGAPTPAPLAVRAPSTPAPKDKVPVREAPRARRTDDTIPTASRKIAIVGVAGRYPMARDLDEYWEVLREGRDCITEVPSDRWDHRLFEGGQKGDPGKIYSKWGGFLDGVGEFDPAFFHISPIEATLMDPQERLFLQTAWQAVEDAGYTRQKLARFRAGVFVGVMYGHYQLLGVPSSLRADGYVPSSSYASIANRVSYVLDLHGPSMAVDTMCSSSLTALHLAVQSMLTDACDLAIAGGVNLSLHPSKYQMLSQGRFAASDGRCRSFGAGGDGYVPGEGVGAVVLKPLERALADGDRIYASIVATALNHGGKTNGYSVPNPKAQAEVVAAALARAGIAPSDVSYVEAHGTGTALGDPIEIAALTSAFRPAGTEPSARRCRIGSVKSNVGHLEAAAGMAALTKVLLQLEHRQLVPSLHSDTVNPHIDFERSPFDVQRALEPWESTGMRRAGISSFGAGGANAHLVVEETPEQASPHADVISGPEIIVLSAADRARLAEQAEQLCAYLSVGSSAPVAAENVEVTRIVTDTVAELLGLSPEEVAASEDLDRAGLDRATSVHLSERLRARLGVDLPPARLAEHASIAHLAALVRPLLPKNAARPTRELPLADIAFTLQTGREPMAARLAVIATDVPDLVAKLGAFRRDEEIAGVYARANASDAGDAESLLEGEAGESFALRLAEDDDLDRLARLWALGANVDWTRLRRATRRGGRIVRLPTYPFARGKYWVAGEQEVPALLDAPPVEARPANAPEVRRAAEDVETTIRRTVAGVLGATMDQIDPRATFPDLGLESVAVVKLAELLSNAYAIDLSPAVLYEQSSVRRLARHLISAYPGLTALGAPPPSVPKLQTERPVLAPAAKAVVAPTDIAIIGASGRFPQSRDLDELWDNLRSMRDLVSEVPRDRWDWTAFKEGTKARWGGFISDADKFDARFFRLSAAEASMMDPQQRVFLETVWHTLEDAGYAPRDLAGRAVGVFAGVQFHDYRERLTQQGEINPQIGLGNEHSILVNRTSFFFDFRGPSEPFNTACSSSLVALHRAVAAMRAGECELAIVGGVSLMLSPTTTLVGESMGILSPAGRCKTLDASADGYVRGEGVGAMLLKPLARAIADGDHVHAVIRGTAVNHGGRAASLTAPRSDAQSELIVQAFRAAGVEPASVTYLELHGTGTKLGDPIEIEGIKSAYRAMGVDPGATAFCGLGTVKANMGHLEPAAGMAGLCKMVLALRHRTLPGLVHLRELNPYVRLDGSPFYVVRETQPWAPGVGPDGAPTPLRCGVSSFGFGGVNAHVVLEEAPHPDIAEERAPEQLPFVLSARSEDRLKEQARLLAAHLGRSGHGAAPRLCDVAYTLLLGREPMEERLALWATSVTELASKLLRFAEGTLEPSEFARGRCSSDEPGPGKTVQLSDAQAFAEAWVNGAPSAWDMSGLRTARRIRLPAYPFERRSHWAIRAAAVAPTQTALSQRTPSSSTTPASGNADAVVDVLRSVLAEQLKEDIGMLTPDTVFADVGVDSIMAASIIEKVRARYGEGIPMSVLFDYATIGELAAWLASEGATNDADAGLAAPAAAAPQRAVARARALPPELVTLGSRGSGQPSFWIHGGTGLAALYNGLARTLSPDFPVYALQARGFDGKTVPRTFEEMVSHYVDSIRAVQIDGPYVIGGYSSGGVIAYEVARRLHVSGSQVKNLVMFDTVPSVPEAFNTFFKAYGGGAGADFLVLMTANELIGARKSGGAAVTMRDIEGLLDSRKAARAASIAARAGRNGLSADDMFGFIRGSLELGAVVEEMYMHYRGEPYDGSDVTYFRAREFLSSDNAMGMMPREVWGEYDYVEPWRRLTTKAFDVVDLPCDHFNMLEEPFLRTSSAKIREILTKP